MNTPKISVIVPVYKAEKYLRRCLDSIVAQTFTDWECILIDDGSPDNSGKICDEYAEMDGRFRVIHQENAGVSAARQKGLDNCIGEYVIHIDPDDWVEKNMLEELYDKANMSNADMVMCDFCCIYANRKVFCCQKPNHFNSNDLINDLLNDKLWGVTWNKLVKRNCFIKYNITFPKDMSLWEDLYINISLLMHNIKVTYIPLTLYNYDCFSNQHSIVRHYRKEHIMSTITFVSRLEPLLSEKQFENGWFCKKSFIKTLLFFATPKIYGIDVRVLYSEINSRFIKTYNNITRREYCVALLLKGYPRIANILSYFIKIKNKFLH